jgi:origin recognition complex subunit 6
MPTIRSLCKALEIPYTAPHVYVGVSSISRVIREQQASVTSTPSKKRVRRTTGNDAISTVVSEFEEAHVPALIVVVGFFTLSHLQGPPRPEDYVKLRKKAVDAVTRSTPDEVRKDDDSTIAAVEALLREAENGWLDMEWYQNLPQPVADSGEATDETNGAATEFVEDEERPIQRLELPKRGFGSMMTDTTDWLSDERRADYRHWKAGILNKIALVQKQDKEKRIK